MADEPGSNPAGEALRAEVGDIMSNKANPLHAGYWAKDAKVMEQIDQKYASVYGGGKGSLLDSVSAGGEADAPAREAHADATAQAEADANLRQELGADYEPVLTAGRPVAAHLFPGLEGRAAFDFVAERLAEYGPKAEVLVARLFADLAKLKGR